MSGHSHVRIDLNQLESLAASYVVATWTDAAPAPSLLDDDGARALSVPDGRRGLTKVLEAVRKAEVHGGGLAESARALADVLERALSSFDDRRAGTDISDNPADL
jgi:hypothetical protein